MDDIGIFLLVLLIIILVFLNFHFITQNNIKLIVSRLRETTAQLADLTDSMNVQFAALDARLSALEEAGAAREL
jgi:hypothetical protein